MKLFLIKVIFICVGCKSEGSEEGFYVFEVRVVGCFDNMIE